MHRPRWRLLPHKQCNAVEMRRAETRENKKTRFADMDQTDLQLPPHRHQQKLAAGAGEQSTSERRA